MVVIRRGKRVDSTKSARMFGRAGGLIAGGLRQSDAWDTVSCFRRPSSPSRPGSFVPPAPQPFDLHRPRASNEEPMSDHIKHVSDATFDKDVLKSSTPVLVDYWAEWCGPCKMIAPVLEDIAKTYAGRLTVAKLDIDANPATTSSFGIRGIPTLILFKDGKPHAQKVGAMSKSQLTAFVDSNL
jgi:thioredoxin 1